MYERCVFGAVLTHGHVGQNFARWPTSIGAPCLSTIFDGLFHVIKSLIILIASFVRGYIMILKLHEWSQEHITYWVKFMLCLLSFIMLCVVLFFLKICIIIQSYVRSVFWKKGRSVLSLCHHCGCAFHSWYNPLYTSAI
jgi:uncharacterized membrane protein